MDNYTLINDLPKSMPVRIAQNKKTKVWVAELTDQQVCTEADTYLELVWNINDLIYTYYDIPKSLQSQIKYVPSQNKPNPKNGL